MSNKLVSNNQSTNKNKKNESNNNNNNNNMNPHKNIKVQEEIKTNYCLIPIIAVLCIVPFIVRLKVYNPHMEQYAWFNNQVKALDFFAYYKHDVLIFLAAVMAVICLLKISFDRKSKYFSNIFVPLIVYASFATLSAVFSSYKYFSMHGIYEQFESLFVLLSYCVIAYYSFLFIKSEHDLKIILYILIAVAIIMSILGIFQLIGHDFFTTNTAYKIVVPKQYQKDLSNLSNKAAGRQIYLTLYNPNYVGVYVALIAPVIAIMLFFQKKIVAILLSIISVIGLLICIAGAKSLSGLIGLGAAVFLIIILMWKYLIKRFYFTIPIIIILVGSALLINYKTDNYLVDKLHIALHPQNATYAVSEMHTENDCVSLTYKEEKLSVKYFQVDQTASFVIIDGDNHTIVPLYDSTQNVFVIPDGKYPGLYFGVDKDVAGIFYIQLDDGLKYRFTNQLGDDKYYYVTAFGKFDKLITAPSAFFTGYENFASSRGYIWSRTIPLLKDYIFLGSGPDTYAIAFPQQDYMYLKRIGLEGQLLTKPHCMYLKMSIETGMLSLLAFLMFYVMYFVSSIRLYIKERFNSYYSRYGVAIFIGVSAYMVAGLANDSNVHTAPMFWTMIGIGIAVNKKVKEEQKAEKLAKQG